jgi:dienelactone hydrolase
LSIALERIMGTDQVIIPLKEVSLTGDLSLPPKTVSLIIFAHGSGSSRHSPRNQLVARTLQSSGMGTLLFDLLTEEEESAEVDTGRLRFDIPFLADRLVAATTWVSDNATNRDLNIGYFGSSTGAAAALVGAAKLREDIGAVVSRGGRPDLAGNALDEVRAPTLLIVGGNDPPVVPLNEQAYERLRGERALRIVPGASHLFAEPGKLELVAQMAAEWFLHHLQPIASRS